MPTGYNSSLFPNTRKWNPVRLFEDFRDYQISPRAWAKSVREMIIGGKAPEAQEACRLLWDNGIGDEIPRDQWKKINQLFADRKLKRYGPEPLWDHGLECGCVDCCEYRDFE